MPRPRAAGVHSNRMFVERWKSLEMYVRRNECIGGVHGSRGRVEVRIWLEQQCDEGRRGR